MLCAKALKRLQSRHGSRSDPRERLGSCHVDTSNWVAIPEDPGSVVLLKSVWCASYATCVGWGTSSGKSAVQRGPVKPRCCHGSRDAGRGEEDVDPARRRVGTWKNPMWAKGVVEASSKPARSHPYESTLAGLAIPTSKEKFS